MTGIINVTFFLGEPLGQLFQLCLSIRSMSLADDIFITRRRAQNAKLNERKSLQ